MLYVMIMTITLSHMAILARKLSLCRVRIWPSKNPASIKISSATTKHRPAVALVAFGPAAI